MLRDQLNRAKQQRDEASKRFAELLHEIPGGLPAGDGTYRLHQASREYYRSLEAVATASLHLSDFLLKGTLSAGLDLRKDPARELPKPPKEKSG